MTTETIPLTQDQGVARPDGPGSQGCAPEPATQSQPVGADPSRVALGAVIGFTGTRHPLKAAQKEALVSALLGFREGGSVWMHNGDCEGADEFAANAWRALGGKVHLHPPSDNRARAYVEHDFTEPTRPYLQRNAKIVRACTVLIATPLEYTEQVRGGTWSTVRVARRLNRPAMIIPPNGKWRAENWPGLSDSDASLAENAQRSSGEAVAARAAPAASPETHIAT